jgi:hypothetical protein
VLEDYEAQFAEDHVAESRPSAPEQLAAWAVGQWKWSDTVPSGP